MHKCLSAERSSGLNVEFHHSSIRTFLHSNFYAYVTGRPCNLTAPVVSLRLTALVTLLHDAVNACGTGTAVCGRKWRLLGP